METIAINLINDRIAGYQAKLECLLGLRSEILSTAAMESGGSDLADPTPAAEQAADTAPEPPKRQIRITPAQPSKPPRKACKPNGSITTKLEEWLSAELPGFEFRVADAFKAIGIQGGSHTPRYNTAQSAIHRLVKAGILSRSGCGSCQLIKPLSGASVPASTKEQEYAAFRAGIGKLETPEA